MHAPSLSRFGMTRLGLAYRDMLTKKIQKKRCTKRQ